MSKIYTIKIIDLHEESDDFLYDIRRILKHNYELYVTDYIKTEEAYCDTCKYNDGGKCTEFDELVNNDSNVCFYYRI